MSADSVTIHSENIRAAASIFILFVCRVTVNATDKKGFMYSVRYGVNASSIAENGNVEESEDRAYALGLAAMKAQIEKLDGLVEEFTTHK